MLRFTGVMSLWSCVIVAGEKNVCDGLLSVWEGLLEYVKK